MKKDEIKFNIGDWVNVDGYFYPKKIKKIDYFNNGYPIINFEKKDELKNIDIEDRDYQYKCSLYELKKGDICWFVDNYEYTPILGEFVQMDKDKYLVSVTDGKGSLELKLFNYMIPFTGTIKPLI